MRARREKEGGGLASPTTSALALLSGSLSDSLGRYLLFIPRQHPLGGLGLHVRQHRAIGGDVIIVLRTIRIGARACAIRLDSIRTGEGLLTSDLPVHVRCNDAFRVAVAIIDLIA